MAAAEAPGTGNSSRPALRERGHDPVAVDLPSQDESAGWSEYTDTVVRAVGDRSDLVVVGHSLGGFTAPLVCACLRAELLVLVEAERAQRVVEGAEGTVAAHGLARDPDEVDGGHYSSLSRPRELAEHLHAYAAACS